MFTSPLLVSPRIHNKLGVQVETKELLFKLGLIEEQARLTLNEPSDHLVNERQRMIIALVKQIRWGIGDSPRPLDDPEATVRMPQ